MMLWGGQLRWESALRKSTWCRGFFKPVFSDMTCWAAVADGVTVLHTRTSFKQHRESGFL